MEPSIIKRQRVRLGETAAAEGAGPRAVPADPTRQTGRTARALEKKAEPILLGGVVRAIEFTCSCGEVTLVELEYPGPKNEVTT